MPYITPNAEHLARRRRALALVWTYGYSPAAAARRVGVHRSTVGRWIHDSQRRACYATSVRKPGARREAVTLVRFSCWTYAMVARRYGVHRSTVGRWVDRANRLNGTRWIYNESCRPHRSGNALDASVYERIRVLRRQTGRCAPVLRELLRREGIVISAASVGRALHRDGFTRPPRRRSHYAVLARRPRARYPGDLVEVDVIHVMKPSGNRYFVVTLVDVASRWAHAAYLTRCQWTATLATVQAAQRAAPFRFKMIQTDRGREFAEQFCAGVLVAGMRIRHIRPHRPNDNAHVERFNRTIREECIGRDPVPDDEIPRKLSRYLRYYNAERPHMGLGLAAPLQAIEKLGLKP